MTPAKLWLEFSFLNNIDENVNYSVFPLDDESISRIVRGLKNDLSANLKINDYAVLKDSSDNAVCIVKVRKKESDMQNTIVLLHINKNYQQSLKPKHHTRHMTGEDIDMFNERSYEGSLDEEDEISDKICDTNIDGA